MRGLRCWLIKGDEMYLIIWKFKIKENFEHEFEQAYGSKGLWAEFFRREKGNGFLGTEFLKAIAEPYTYLTIDRWETQMSYEKFCKKWRKEYEAIDKQCEKFTSQELKIGIFYENLASNSTY